LKGISFLLLAPLLVFVPVFGADVRSPPEIHRKQWIAVTVPSATIAVGCEQEGAIAHLPVVEGDVVKEGQVLFELTTRVQQLEVQRLAAIAESDAPVRQAKAELEQAEREEQRALSLHRQDIAGDAELDAKKRNANVARIRVDQARVDQRVVRLRWQEAKERLAQRTVKSPINGHVAVLKHQRGETVEKLEPVLLLVQLEPLWIEFDCPIEDEEYFRLGATVGVHKASSGGGDGAGTSRAAKVVFVATTVNPASQTFRVRLQMKNANHPWKAGLKVWVESTAEDR
jgi:RND family efflux transporter MFP subunit